MRDINDEIQKMLSDLERPAIALTKEELGFLEEASDQFTQCGFLLRFQHQRLLSIHSYKAFRG